MLKIKDSNIFLTRGDSASLKIKVKDIEGKDFIFTEDFKLVFSVKKNISDKYLTIQKEVQNSINIEIVPEDTKQLAFGEYYFDIELQMNNKIFTIITPHKFIICEEVS